MSVDMNMKNMKKLYLMHSLKTLNLVQVYKSFHENSLFSSLGLV